MEGYSGEESCWGSEKVCQKNTSTLLLECTEIFKSSIFISLFHTSDGVNGRTHKWKQATKGLKSGTVKAFATR